MFIFHVWFLPHVEVSLLYLWGGITLLCFAYPFFGLILEKAPLWSYIAVLCGPFFIFWRTWLRVQLLLGKKVGWVRTYHRSSLQSK
jgi:hypothetical protein